MNANFSKEKATGLAGGGGRCLRGRFDFAAIADRFRMPWRFLARQMAVDGILVRI
jgi:hypothetical protein